MDYSPWDPEELDTTECLTLSLLILFYIYMYVYIYIMKKSSAIKKGKIFPFATTWMDLEGIMLIEMLYYAY